MESGLFGWFSNPSLDAGTAVFDSAADTNGGKGIFSYVDSDLVTVVDTNTRHPDGFGSFTGFSLIGVVAADKGAIALGFVPNGFPWHCALSRGFGRL